MPHSLQPVLPFTPPHCREGAPLRTDPCPLAATPCVPALFVGWRLGRGAVGSWELRSQAGAAAISAASSLFAQFLKVISKIEYSINARVASWGSRGSCPLGAGTIGAAPAVRRKRFLLLSSLHLIHMMGCKQARMEAPAPPPPRAAHRSSHKVTQRYCLKSWAGGSYI